MRVLRIELEAPVCSFRYPHFLVGRQLTFEMPPPSTIFGHVASALGEWPDPSSFRFAYHFVASGKGDVESQHIVYPGSGKFMAGGEKHPAALHATIQPVPRQFLLGVRLVLYLDRVDLIEAFRNPRFPVILGRSQDLACYSRVEVVGLERADRGYFEATILPAEFRKRTERGMTVLMSRYIGLAVWISSDFPVRAAHFRLSEVESDVRLPSDPVEDFRGHAALRIRKALAAYGRLERRLTRQPATSGENLEALALRGLILMADHTASAHVRPAGAPLGDIESTVMRMGLGSLGACYLHQQLAARTAGNSLLAAPTGSGKTEAAILWAARQFAGIEPCGRIYYVLPYQASLNAMHARLSGHFPAAVALQHSRSLQALYRSLLHKEYVPKDAERTARREHALARLQCHPIRVLTPYQLLRAAFRLKGYEAVLTETANGLFIFDEIHAYEPRRLGMILGIIEYFRISLGGRFLVMSATFPAVLRNTLTLVLGERAELNADNEFYRGFARHRLKLVEGEITDAPNLQAMADCARSGKSVLVVCNTVTRAVEAQRRIAELLRESEVPVGLIHGRFNARDRFQKEQQWIERMGSRLRNRAAGAAVLVATQVVEVSLDIDFDTVFTEPAPLESIVQRFGRVNRARRNSSCDVHVLMRPLSGQHVYEDDFVVRALNVLSGRDGEAIDESQIERWLNSVYEGQVGDAWAREVSYWKGEFVAACLAGLRAFQSSPELAEKFDRMFDGTEVLPSGLWEEYQELRVREPLRAGELLVPISARQLARLRREGRIASRPGEDPTVVNVPYDSTSGLVLRDESDDSKSRG